MSLKSPMTATGYLSGLVETELSVSAPPELFSDVDKYWDVPAPLVDWLHDLVLLKGVPFGYLVPEPEMLPPESLRFFYVDPNWQIRMVEGALHAGTSGTADDDDLFEGFRRAVLSQLGRRPGGPGGDKVVTGMLLRSALVRYHPRMSVRAFAKVSNDQGADPLPVVRRARLSQSVMLVMWEGVPARVELEEPHEGTRFGVDEPNGLGFDLEVKDESGKGLDKEVVVPMRVHGGREGAVHVDLLRKRLEAKVMDVPMMDIDGEAEPRDVARQLQQTPFRAIFQGARDAMNDTPNDSGGGVMVVPDAYVLVDWGSLVTDLETLTTLIKTVED